MKRKKKNLWFVLSVVLLCAVALAFLLYPIVSLAVEAIGAYLHTWGVLSGIGGILLRTLLLLFLVILMTFPLSFLIFLLLQRRARWGKTVRSGITGVSRLPAVLMGLIGFLVFRNHKGMQEHIFPMAVLLTVMFIPSCLFHMEQAILSLPQEYRMAGEALGGSNWQVLTKVLLPIAKPELFRAGIELIEDILCEATALLVLMGSISGGRVISTELFRLAYLGRPDAAVLAFLLMTVLIVLRFLTSRRFKREREDSGWQYNWW